MSQNTFQNLQGKACTGAFSIKKNPVQVLSGEFCLNSQNNVYE